jgi:quercetin 2,3-dioxygenase
VTATSGAPADVVLLGGVHIDEPRLFSGPFVMDTPERIEGAKRDFSSGRMGRLDGVPF